MSEKVLTLTQLSKFLGIKKRTLYNMLRTKRFPVEPIKGTSPRLWSVGAVTDWRDGVE